MCCELHVSEHAAVRHTPCTSIRILSAIPHMSEADFAHPPIDLVISLAPSDSLTFSCLEKLANRD